MRWPIQYERLSLGHWSDLKEAVCVNVGAHGMLLLLHDCLEAEEIIKLHMRDVNRDLPFTLAQVRWSQPTTAELHVAMIAGVEYLDQHDAAEYLRYACT